MAKALGLSARQVFNWEHGESPRRVSGDRGAASYEGKTSAWLVSLKSFNFHKKRADKIARDVFAAAAGLNPRNEKTPAATQMDQGTAGAVASKSSSQGRREPASRVSAAAWLTPERLQSVEQAEREPPPDWPLQFYVARSRLGITEEDLLDKWDGPNYHRRLRLHCIDNPNDEQARAALAAHLEWLPIVALNLASDMAKDGYLPAFRAWLESRGLPPMRFR